MLVPIIFHIPTTVADTTDEWYIPMGFKGRWRVQSCYFAPATAVTANDTNYVQVTLDRNTLAAPTSFSTLGTITTQITGGAAFVIGTSRAFTLSGDVELVQGETLRIGKTDPGTGAILDGTFMVVMEKVG